MRSPAAAPCRQSVYIFSCLLLLYPHVRLFRPFLKPEGIHCLLYRPQGAGLHVRPFPGKKLPAGRCQKAVIQQEDDAGVLHGADNPARCLQDPVHSRKPVGIIKAVQSPFLVKRLQLLPFVGNPGQARTRHRNADKPVSRQVDALGENPAHDTEGQKPALPAEFLQETLPLLLRHLRLLQQHRKAERAAPLRRPPLHGKASRRRGKRPCIFPSSRRPSGKGTGRISHIPPASFSGTGWRRPRRQESAGFPSGKAIPRTPHSRPSGGKQLPVIGYGKQGCGKEQYRLRRPERMSARLSAGLMQNRRKRKSPLPVFSVLTI